MISREEKLAAWEEYGRRGNTLNLAREDTDFACPQCKKALRLPPGAANGDLMKCPLCEGVSVIEELPKSAGDGLPPFAEISTNGRI